MESLFAKHDRLINLVPTDIIRDAMNSINWKSRLLCIQGAKGVGKSTLIKQYIKLNYAPGDHCVLYCSADSVYFSRHSLLDLAEDFHINGGKYLIIDEIHKYENWSREIKEIYDSYPQMNIIISGSSLLKLLEGDIDLSRRCVRYTMQGLSFREALRFYHGIDIPKYSLEEILTNSSDICFQVNSKCRPVQHFKEYLQYGYYPFFLEGAEDYFIKIEQVLNFIIDSELPQICHVDIANLRKIKALLSIISTSVPFEVDARKLSDATGASRDTVIGYLRNLSDADVLNLLYSEKKDIRKLTKPDKVYMENSNLLYALAPTSVNIGTARETFAVCQLSKSHDVEYGKENGDFKVDGKYTFEIGGRGKGFSQIAGIKDSYIFADDLEYPDGEKLPLWILGLLY